MKPKQNINHERPMTLPDSFTQYTQALMGEERYARFLDALHQPAPVSIRLNKAKGIHAPLQGEQVPWCEEGFYLAERPAFTFDPLLHAGCYYVQEAASMFVGHALRQYAGDAKRPLLALDLCAAPGGKSTAALAALPRGSVMVSNEPVRQRAQILAENISKWGNPNTFVTNNYPQDFLPTGLKADVIICDVPCSGEGMFRKDTEAVGEWSPQNVEKCWRLQRDIVATAWQLLAEGGLMVYSTCTFNLKENEENVRWAEEELGAEVLPIATEAGWVVTSSLLRGFSRPVCRFIPGLTRGEGLFLALLRKPGEGTVGADGSLFPPGRKQGGSERRKEKKGKGRNAAALGIPSACLPWLESPEAYATVTAGDTVFALPTETLHIYNKVEGKLRLLKAGIALAQQKGRDLIPQQGLALSTALRRGAFPEAELSHAEAIAYLRREPVTLPSTTPRGYTLITYQGHALGFAKNLGARANNLYPPEWRIKSSHAPEKATNLF